MSNYGTIEVVSYDEEKDEWVLRCSSCGEEFSSLCHPGEESEMVCRECGDIHYKNDDY